MSRNLRDKHLRFLEFIPSTSLSMLKTIEKLREKPEAYRKRIAFIIAISIAGIIFLIWLSVLGVKFRNSETIVSDVKKESLFAEAQKGFSEILATGNTHFDEVKKGIESAIQQQ